MLLTIDEVRAQVSTALIDDALQLILDALEAEIVRIGGDPDATVDLVAGGSRLITLTRPVSVVTSITETVGSSITTLATDDYLVHPGGYIIERLQTGTNGRWRWWGRVTVSYVPLDELALRKVVQLDLLNLSLNYIPGATSETVGSWTRQLASNSAWNNDKERNSILGRLVPEARMLVVGG